MGIPKKNSFMEWLNNAGHLESTDPMIFRAYLLPMPNSVLKDSVPFMIGVWLGMQFIDEYMSKHPDTGIEQLLMETDYQQMFKDITIE